MFRLETKMLLAYARVNFKKIIILVLSITLGITSVLLLTESSFTAVVDKVPRNMTVTTSCEEGYKDLIKMLGDTDTVRGIELKTEIPDIYLMGVETIPEDYQPNYIYIGAVHKDVDVFVTMLFGEKLQNENEMVLSDYSSINYGVGDTISIGDKEFTIVGQGAMLAMIEAIVKEKDFYDLCQKLNVEDIKIDLYYDAYTRDKELEDIAKKCKEYECVQEISISESKMGVMFSEFVNEVKDYLFITVIAIINSVFIYYSFVKDRVREYSILKIAGLNNLQITLQFLSEIVMLYNGGYILSMIITIIYKNMRGNGYYNFIKVCIYSYISVLACFVIIYFVVLRQIIKKTPMELYRESRILK